MNTETKDAIVEFLRKLKNEYHWSFSNDVLIVDFAESKLDAMEKIKNG